MENIQENWNFLYSLDDIKMENTQMQADREKRQLFCTRVLKKMKPSLSGSHRTPMILSHTHNTKTDLASTKPESITPQNMPTQVDVQTETKQVNATHGRIATKQISLSEEKICTPKSRNQLQQ